MDGIGLDNMLSAEQVEKMFSDEAPTQTGETVVEETPNKGEANDTNTETDETAEVDFSDLLGTNQPESVGSEETTKGTGGAPESNNDTGTPQNNLFSSIARILRDKGVFPDLSDEDADAVDSEEALEKLFNDKVSSMLDERQRNLEKALSGGADSVEMQQYQNAMNVSQFLEKPDTLELLTSETDEGEKFRKQVMYQDFLNRGFKQERAMKLIEKSFADGNEMEDAKEAFESCREFYKVQIEDFEKTFEDRKKQQRAAEDRQYANLKKRILDTESFYDGVKVDKNIRQKAYDSITKPVFRDDQGNYLTALQKYQRENPIEFMENVALLYALTDNFKNVDKLAKGKVKAGLKKGFAELEGVLNSTRRNGDGSLNLANTGMDFSERDNWSLA